MAAGFHSGSWQNKSIGISCSNVEWQQDYDRKDACICSFPKTEKNSGGTMKPSIVLIIVLLVIANSSEAFSRLIRVSNIPNGRKFSCRTCHDMSDTKYTTRNAFGKEIEANYLQPTVPIKMKKVMWQAALAALDSDGDGYTNGQELDDPNGTITNGDSTNFAIVTNPGDPTSHPMNPATEIIPLQQIAKLTSIINTRGEQAFAFAVGRADEYSFSLVGSNGSQIASAVKFFSEGHYTLTLDEIGMNTSELESGLYFLAVNSRNYFQAEKFIIKR